MNRLACFLFDYTARAAEPWRAAGYETLSLDIAHSIRTPREGCAYADLTTIGPALVILRRLGYTPKDLIFLGCFPVCTDVAVSGARDHKRKGLRALAQSTKWFATCQEFSELTDAPGFIENPITTMATHWRKPDYYFHPFQYTAFEPEDNYKKKTSIWGFNGFVMPPEARLPSLPEPDDRIHKAPPSSERAAFRSAGPRGFLRAVFESNKPTDLPNQLKH